MVEFVDFSLFYEEEHHRLIALENLTCKLEKRKITAIIGESGAGKTSLAKALMAHLPSNATVQGSLKVDGVSWLDQESAQQRLFRQRHIAYMPQGGSENLNPLLSVGAQLREVMAPRFTCKGLLESVGLKKEVEERTPRELSGGEVSRVLLALALASDAPCLVLDEPTAGLDETSKRSLEMLFDSLRAQGKTLVLITHDLELAHRVSDVTWVLYLGQLLEVLPSSELFARALHPYTIALSRVFPRMDRAKDIVKIKGESTFRLIHRHATSHVHAGTLTHVHVEVPGCVYAPRCTQPVARCYEEKPPFKATQKGFCACYFEGMRPLIALESVSFAYPRSDALVLQNFSLSLKRGEIVALVGDSGSGKSTVAKLMAGMLAPKEGRVVMEEALRVGMVHQHPMQALNPRFSAYESIAEPLVLGRFPRERLDARVREVALACGLGEDRHVLDLAPHKLSLGTLQRVCMARALANYPDVIIADEPTSALDPSVQARVVKTLLDLQVEIGVGVLLITHNLALARKIADIIGILKNGKLVYRGSVEACPLL
ncbi:MAG: ABC transporter ATP-binding protein [Campylobacterales bacterium]|nr:ABC transporter ATP-binding protein [Campylobacterales bacterium]